MMTRSFISFDLVAILLLTLQNVSALCGREGFRMTGSAAVKPIAIAWARAYASQCGWQVIVDPTNGGLLSTQTNIIITEEPGDIPSDVLCTTSSSNLTNTRISNADIVMSNRPIFNRLPSPIGPYNCTGTNSNTSRGFIQVEAAVDSISVIVNRTGIANDCISILGGGLTQDQLRWIFSKDTTTQLQAMGWSNASLSRGTGPINERRWSRLHMRCSRSLISVAIPSPNNNYYNFFQGAVMKNASQGSPPSLITTLPVSNFKNDEEIANFVRNNIAAIGYIGYPTFITKQDKLRAVAIQNNIGSYVVPNEISISSNSYNPLSRRLYMTVRQDTLINARYFLEFAYSNYGDQITRGNGYTQVPTRDQFIMLSELGSIDPACLGNQTGCLILPAQVNTNCISLASIECCSGNNNLRISIADNAEKHFNIWKIYFEAACQNTQITLIKNIQSSSSSFRTCKLSPESDFLDIAAVGSKISQINNPNLYPVSDPKFTYKCTKNQASFQAYSPPRSLLEFTMAPNPERFIYANRASSARSRTRCFLKFALCSLGTQVIQCNGLSFNDVSVTTSQMCKRNIDY